MLLLKYFKLFFISLSWKDYKNNSYIANTFSIANTLIDITYNLVILN